VNQPDRTGLNSQLKNGFLLRRVCFVEFQEFKPQANPQICRGVTTQKSAKQTRRNRIRVLQRAVNIRFPGKTSGSGAGDAAARPASFSESAD